MLDALQSADKQLPVRDRRFTLVHAYFPALDAIQRAKQLGVCVDTQVDLYYKDSDAIAEIYGNDWAERFIGVGDWIRGGIPTAINGDHMIVKESMDAVVLKAIEYGRHLRTLMQPS